MPDTIAYELSAHATTVMSEREILEEWVARVLHNPERTEPDAADPSSAMRSAASPSGMTGSARDLQRNRSTLAGGYGLFRPGNARLAMRMQYDQQTDAL